MTRWLGMVADWLQPIYQTIGRSVLEGGYVQVDETPIKFLEPGNGKASQGYLWTYHRPENGNGGDVFFDWQTGRAASCLEKVIPADFGVRGIERPAILQCDGYSA